MAVTLLTRTVYIMLSAPEELENPSDEECARLTDQAEALMNQKLQELGETLSTLDKRLYVEESD